MMLSRACVFCTLILFVNPGYAGFQSDIKYNPFSYTESNKSTKRENSVRHSSKTPKAKRVHWKPQLFATISAGSRSMANVGGKIVKLGKSINGFRLIAVDKKSATFEKSGYRYVLKIESVKVRQ